MTLQSLSPRRNSVKPFISDEPDLKELQRFAELGRLSASLLHEISNPLTAAMLHLELSDPSLPIVGQLKRDIEIIRRYVESARQQVRLGSNIKNFNVRTEINQLKRVVMPLAKRANVRVEIEAETNLRLTGDPVKFQHLLANLIVNAIDAYDVDPEFEQASLVKVSVSGTRRWIRVTVQDWGKGIPAADLPHLFEPFYTTKGRSGRGLGIGLSIVKEYVTRDFHGSIKVSSSRRRGTQFAVRLLAA